MSVEEKEPESPRAESPRQHLWGDGPQESAAAQFLDNLYGVLFSPRATFADLAARPPMGQALALYLLILAVNGLASLPALQSGLGRVGMRAMLPSLTGFLTPFYLVVTLVSWLVGAALLHLVAEWLGGQGRATDLFALGAFYRVPQLFMAPLALVSALTWPGLTTPFSLLLAAWTLVLQVLALRANYRFATSRAILVLLLPFVLGIVLVTGLVVSAILLAVPFLPHGLRGL